MGAVVGPAGRSFKYTTGLTLAFFAGVVLTLAMPAFAAADPGSAEVKQYRLDFNVPAAQAEEALEVQADGAEIDIGGKIENRLDSRYSGIWFDNQTGEFVVPLPPGTSAATVASQFAQADLSTGDFRTSQVASTWEELEAAQRLVDQKLLPALEAGYLETSLDPRTNAVVISEAKAIGGDVQGEVRNIAANSLVKVEIRTADAARFDGELEACSDPYCDSPLRGGVEIFDPASPAASTCTAGFPATGNNGHRYLVTAGHCVRQTPFTPLYDEWASKDSALNSHLIGAAEQWESPLGGSASADWAKINASGSNWNVGYPWPTEVVYWGTPIMGEGGVVGKTPPVNLNYPIYGVAASVVGNYACHSGIKTGTTCGPISGLNVSHTSGNGVTHGLNKIDNACSVPGDSGGPYFFANSALGLHVDSETPALCGDTLYYSDIVKATAALGVTIGTPPAVAPVTEEDDNALGPRSFVQGNGTLDVFFRNTSGNLGHHWYVPGNGWLTETRSASIAATSLPRVIAQPNGTLDVFFRDTSGNLGHHWYVQGNGWLTETRSASMASDPHVVSRTTGVVDVFFRDTSGNLGHHWYVPGNGWLTETRSASMGSEPRPVVQAGGTVDVFFRDTSGNLGHHWYVPGNGWLVETRSGPITARPPLATTQDATGVSAQAATMNATVNPELSGTSYAFEYGLTTKYGSQKPAVAESVGSGDDNVAVSQTLSGLTPQTEYHYRVVATNSEGTAYGANQTFTTGVVVNSTWSSQATTGIAPKTEQKLEATSCPTASFCMAVGKDNYAIKGFGEVWNGSAWSTASSVDGTLVSVSCISAIWCMTVGSLPDGTARSHRFTELGGTWTPLSKGFATPAGGSEVKIYDVSCTATPTNACTAVGSYYDGTRTVSLVERWTGVSWSVQSTPNPASGTTELLGVSCTSATSCMAVGRNEGVTFAASWNGTTWSTSTTPNPIAATESRLVDVSCGSTSSCIAVGYFKEGTAWKRALAERWNGSSWSVQGLPNPVDANGNLSLNDVACPTATACTAVGAYGTEKGATAGEDLKGKTLVEAWNGSAWSTQSGPNDAAEKFSVLYGVGCSAANACTGVGIAGPAGSTVDGTETFGGAWNGTAWSSQAVTGLTPKTEQRLTSTSCPTASFCMAVGKDEYSRKGFAEVWNGSSWGTTNRLDGAINSVSCVSATWCMTVGNNVAGNPHSFRFAPTGGIWNYETKTPATPAGGSEVKLNDVSCTSTEACTAVGSYFNGTRTVSLAERWNGSSWSVQSTPNPASGATELSGVSCPTVTACVAVGRNGAVTFAASWNGSVWSTSATPNPGGSGEATLEDISCTSASTCVTVGWYRDGSPWKKALAERAGGGVWSLQSLPSPAGAIGNIVLNDVSCTVASVCEAVGSYGTEKGPSYGIDLNSKTLVEALNGSHWSVQSSPNSAQKFNALNGVACISISTCMAVGSAGPDRFWGDGTVTLGARYQ